MIPWRTSFEDIHQAVELFPISVGTPAFIDSYEGTHDKIWVNGELRYSFVYFFYQNQLVGGSIRIHQKVVHDEIAKNISELWGTPDAISPNGKIRRYEFPTTDIMYRTGPDDRDPDIYGRMTFHDPTFLATSIKLQTKK